MKNSELYTDDESKLFDTIEKSESVSLVGSEFEKEKAILTRVVVNTIDNNLKVFEERENEESIFFENFIKTLEADGKL